jgi:nitronate monooxygenase
MDLHTPVCDLLCCHEPIVLAGMGGVARSELVAAVTNAGGFGFLGMVRESPDLIRAEIAAVRARTSRPFGVNLIPAATKPARLDAELAACIEARVHAVALFWDLSAEAVARLRSEGVLVVCQVGSVEEAVAAQAAGADVLVAQGLEAGGHVRGVTARDVLLRDVVAAVERPVLAAGGVTDGRDLAAVLRLGAQGGVVGTAFLATEESFAHGYHKRRIVESSGATVHTDAFHINWPEGAYVRVLPNSVTQGERGDPHATGRQVIGADGQRPIYLFSTDSPLRSMTGDFEAMALYAGIGAGRIQDVPTAAERLRQIADGARRLLAPPPPRRIQEADPAEPSSPVCYASEADDVYMGYAAADELADELNSLLEAERARAWVAARMVAESRDAEMRTLAQVLHADEVRWCKALFQALNGLGATPSAEVGDFYRKAMAIADLEARLAFVDRGRAWLVRKLRALVPRVRDAALHDTLQQMLLAHERNIGSAAAALDRPSAATLTPPGPTP